MIALILHEVLIIAQGYWVKAAESGLLILLISIILTGIAVYYWINCYKLHKVNAAKKLQDKLKAQ